jgi:hypothetical protein
MWIFLNDAYLSVVQYKDQPDKLLVRARFKGDLQRVFGQNINVIRNSGTDYLYRTVVDRAEVAKILAQRVMAIDYPNFKASIRNDRQRHDTYLDVWHTLKEAQETQDAP